MCQDAYAEIKCKEDCGLNVLLLGTIHYPTESALTNTFRITRNYPKNKELYFYALFIYLEGVNPRATNIENIKITLNIN